MLINSTGEQKELACFQPGENTEAFYSCSIQWKNLLHIFGGLNEKRQISRLTGHKLERVGSLAFDLTGGACNVMANQYILLCFNLNGGSKLCRRSTDPLKTFTEEPLSNHEHRYARTGCTNSKYFFYSISHYY